MQEASFFGFMKTVFYILVFYYVFKFLAKLFLPFLLKKAVEKAGQKFGQHQGMPQDKSWKKTSTSDDISIDTTNAKKYPKTKNTGEYVDYEEIK